MVEGADSGLDVANEAVPDEDEVRLVANLGEVRIRMHESRTSAVISFTDERGSEQRVSLIARSGGGALTGCVGKRYVEALQILGYELWPPVPPALRRSGVFKVGSVARRDSRAG